MQSNFLAIILLASAASMAQAALSSSEEKALAKLDQFLASETGSSPNNLASYVKIATTKDKSGYGLFEASLKIANKKFLTIANSPNCSWQVADNMGYLLHGYSSRAQKVLQEEYFTKDKRLECRNSLANLALELDSRMPNETAMQVFLKHFQFNENRFSHPHFNVNNFFEQFYRVPALIDEILAIARERSIVICKFDEKNKDKKVASAQKFTEVTRKFIIEPCKQYSKLADNLIMFTDFLQLEAVKKREIRQMPEPMTNVYYRNKVCELIGFHDNQQGDDYLNVLRKRTFTKCGESL